MLLHRAAVIGILTLFLSLVRAHTYQYVGCFGPPTDLDRQSRNIFLSIGLCASLCAPYNYPVMAVTNETECLCGNSLPPRNRMVEESNCNTPCSGYTPQMCGGDGFFSVYYSEENEPERPPNQTSTAVVDESVATALATAQPPTQKEQLPGDSEL
ncbi:WSC domain-containing protein [Whalleya microplaca]|nr:WSC domain-containing protein [Whalleya microplaca]